MSRQFGRHPWKDRWKGGERRSGGLSARIEWHESHKSQSRANIWRGGGVWVSKEIPRCKANPTQTVWMNLPFCYTLPPVACVRKGVWVPWRRAKEGRWREDGGGREREWRTGGRREEGKKERKEGGERERETRKAEGRWKGVKREWVEGERRNMWFYL